MTIGRMQGLFYAMVAQGGVDKFLLIFIRISVYVEREGYIYIYIYIYLYIYRNKERFFSIQLLVSCYLQSSGIHIY